MPKTFLNLSISVESDEELSDLIARIKGDIEFALDQDQCTVWHITWDRLQALEFVRAQKHEVEVLTRNGKGTCPPIAETVAAVLSLYGFTLPKQKKGAPDWRVPRGHCWGEIEGLPGLRGKVVLTNGIIAYLVRQDGKWCTVHWDWFKVDKEETLPDGVEKPKGRDHKVASKVVRCFEGF